jgi:hypothetical protein
MSTGSRVRSAATPASRAPRSDASPQQPPARELVLRLQRQAGNRAVASLARNPLGDLWDELWKPFTLPEDPRGPASAKPDFDVWAVWDAPGADSAAARTNLTIAGMVPPRPFLMIPAGATGHVRFDIKLSTSVEGRAVTQPMSYSWKVTTNEYGDITELAPESAKLEQPSHKRAPLAVRHAEWLVGAGDPKTRELTLNVGYNGGSETVQAGESKTSGSKWEAGGGVEKGPVKGSGKYESNDSTTTTKGNSTTFEAITGREPFNVKLFVTGAKPRPAAPAAPKTRRRTWYVLFKDEKNTEVRAEEEQWLHRWWESLSPQTREALQKGPKGLVLKGYTSTTGTSKNNRDTAQKRMDDVMAVLNAAAGMQGGRSLIKNPPEEHAYGEGKDTHPTDVKKEERPTFYAKRVEVSVEDLVPAGNDPEYAAVERELIGRGEARVLEQIEEDKKTAKPR